MSKATSVFLDVLRIIAAYGVFLGHCSFPWFAPQVPALAAFGHLGHEFVIVFFVLSGYVIGFSTLSAAQSGEQYLMARLSRLYSVVLPGVCLTEILHFFGTRVNPALYASLDRGNDWVRSLLALFFLQENWFISASPPTNAPLWSLGYEFWYYVLFGILVFTRTMRAKIGLSFLTALVAGPKILLLLPIWFLGVGTYLVLQHVRIHALVAIAGFIAALAGSGWLMISGWQFPQSVGGQTLCYSSAFLSDLALGVAICGTVFFFENIFRKAVVPRFVAAPVRQVADTTFSLYVFHYPLLVFCAAILDVKSLPLWSAVAAIACVLFVVILMSTVTEAKKRDLRDLMVSILQRVTWGRPRPAVAS